MPKAPIKRIASRVSHKDQTAQLEMMPYHMREQYHTLETDLEHTNFARHVPSSHPLSNSLPAMPSDPNLRQSTAEWGNIVDQQKNEFDAYSTIFRPQSETVTDPATLAAAASVFQDDLTMPSAFNLSQN